MKLIHCADLHLDSDMTSNLTKEKAKERRTELLVTFQRMITYAKENDVHHILISGDLYDKKIKILYFIILREIMMLKVCLLE